LIVLDCVGLARLSAKPAIIGPEMGAGITVDVWNSWRSLRMGEIYARPGCEAFVVAGNVGLRFFGCYQIQVDGAGRADKNTRPAPDTFLGLIIKWSSNDAEQNSENFLQIV